MMTCIQFGVKFSVYSKLSFNQEVQMFLYMPFGEKHTQIHTEGTRNRVKNVTYILKDERKELRLLPCRRVIK